MARPAHEPAHVRDHPDPRRSLRGAARRRGAADAAPALRTVRRRQADRAVVRLLRQRVRVVARSIVVYAVSDAQGGGTYPTKSAAIAEARETVARYRASGDDDEADRVEVQRITIPGPSNRDLVGKLLSAGGYASEIDTVWRAEPRRKRTAADADAPLKLRK